ncbi:MAG: repeat protein [Actinomycetia bacterium]|nr:repeat protein [Actinomycetes bacterium]
MPTATDPKTTRRNGYRVWGDVALAHDDSEALIKEARRRQRRRRLLIACLLLVGVVVGGAVYVVMRHTGTRLEPPARSSAPAAGAAGAISPKRPGALALAPRGGLYLADDARNQILERLPNGRFRVVAGNGKRGFSGDGRRAVGAELNNPGAMAVAADGSLYFADTGNNRVRKVSPQGIITTVAGNGGLGWTPNRGRALAVAVSSPTAVAFGPDGRLLIATGDEVLRLEHDGSLTRVAGIRKYAGVYGIGGPATKASADGANGLAFDAAGNLYLAGFNTKALLMIDRRGTMRLPDGGFNFYPRGFGGLVRTPDGHVLAINSQELVEVTPHGSHAIFNFANRSIGGITGFLPAGIAVSRSGLIYTDTGYGNGWSSGSGIVVITAARRIQVRWKK